MTAPVSARSDADALRIERTALAQVPVPMPSRQAFVRRFRHEIRRQGAEPVAATYDAAGNCTLCGESGRCPGAHVPRAA